MGYSVCIAPYDRFSFHCVGHPQSILDVVTYAVMTPVSTFEMLNAC